MISEFRDAAATYPAFNDAADALRDVSFGVEKMGFLQHRGTLRLQQVYAAGAIAREQKRGCGAH